MNVQFDVHGWVELCFVFTIPMCFSTTAQNICSINTVLLLQRKVWSLSKENMPLPNSSRWRLSCLTEHVKLTRELVVGAASAVAQSDNALCIRGSQIVSAIGVSEHWYKQAIRQILTPNQYNYTGANLVAPFRHAMAPLHVDYHNCWVFVWKKKNKNQTRPLHIDATSLNCSRCKSPLSQVCGSNLFSTHAIIICIDNWVVVCIDRAGM